MKSTHAISTFLALASAAFSMAVSAQQAVIPGVGVVVKHGATAASPVEECVRYPHLCKDAKAAPKKSTEIARRFLDINKASEAELKASNLPLLIIIIIMNSRQQGPFLDSADFARRVCPQAPQLNLEQTSLQIGQQQIVYRGGEPKANGFKCGTAPDTYSVNNKIYRSR